MLNKYKVLVLVVRESERQWSTMIKGESVLSWVSCIFFLAAVGTSTVMSSSETSAGLMRGDRFGQCTSAEPLP